MKSTKNLRKTLRNWHRDIGYFTVAITLVYALSGVFMNHKEHFPVITTSSTSKQYPAQLSLGGFSERWEQEAQALSKCYQKNSAFIFYYKGGKGKYDIASGRVTTETYKKHTLLAFIHRLHLNQATGWKYIADLFCLALIVLAISGLYMVKGKNGFKRRGLYMMTAGTVLIAVFIFI